MCAYSTVVLCRAKMIFSHDALDLCIFTSDKESTLEDAGPMGPQGIEQVAQRVSELAETVTEVITRQSKLIKMNRESIDVQTDMLEMLQARTDLLLSFCAPPGFVEEEDEGGILAQRLDQLAELVMAIGISVARMEGQPGGSVADFFRTQGLPDPDDLN
jgi:hypothetical protein